MVSLLPGKLPPAGEICEQLKGAVGTGRDLAPQAETDENPTALADIRTHERAFFPPDVVLERLVDLNEIGIPLICGNDEVRPALLHPVTPRALADLVGIMKDGIVRCENLHLAVLIGDARVAEA